MKPIFSDTIIRDAVVEKLAVRQLPGVSVVDNLISIEPPTEELSR